MNKCYSNSLDKLTDLIKNIKLGSKENLCELQNSEIKPTNSDCVSNNSNLKNCDIFEQKMALALTIDPLKYLGKLPEFSGDYRDLENFINLIDKVHPLLLRYDDISQSIFSDVIKSKLKNKAREIIEINNHITTWPEIKEILTNNFGDRLTMEELFDKLRSVIFKTNAADFYAEIKTVLRRLNVKSKLTLGDDLRLIEQTITNNKNSALTIFKNKLPEPMRSILYCRDPQSLETAMDILHEAGYAYYNANPPKPINSKNKNHNFTNNPNNNNNDKPRINNFNNQSNRNNNNYNKNQNSSNLRNNRNNHTQNQHPNSTARTQNLPYRNNYDNYSQNRPQQVPDNPFRNNPNGNSNNSNQNHQLPPPEPMDINTSETVRPSEIQNYQEQNFHSPASPTNYHIS